MSYDWTPATNIFASADTYVQMYNDTSNKELAPTGPNNEDDITNG